MKYYYLFILITGTILILGAHELELNNDQEKQIDCLIITSQNEEKAVIKKSNGLADNTPYYLVEMFDEVTPMAVNDQFVIPVLKHGVVDREAGYMGKATKAT